MNHTEIDTRAHAFYQDLQSRGIPLDTITLNKQKEALQTQLDTILSSLEGQFGFRPNPNRNEDYAKIAQTKNYPLPKGPSGRPRTDEWTIERAAREVPELKDLQKARSIRRQVSILTNLAAAVRNGRVYPEYSLDPTLGRTHSGGAANPMNWSETAEQQHVSLPGHLILVADFSRIEPKVLATLSGDKQLLADLSRDPYRELATTAFNTVNPTPDQRAKGKVAFLAMIYGTTDKGLAAQLEINQFQARRIMDAWHRRYPQASAFMTRSIQEGRQNGYAESYHGRRKPLDKADPEANDRLAFNSKIQNTAGDLSRIGFTNAANNPELKQMGVEFLLTVHDSLIMAVPVNMDLERVKSILRKELVENNDPRFGLSVEFKVGPTWATAK